MPNSRRFLRDEYYTAISESIRVQYQTTRKANDAPFHFHDDYEIYLFLSGDVDLYTEHVVYRMKRGHLVVCSDRELHRACHYGAQPYERMAVHFDHRLVEGLSTARTNLLGCFRNHLPGIDNAILLEEEQIREILALGFKLQSLTDSERFGSDVLITSVLSELLVLVNSLFLQHQPTGTTPYLELINEVIEYIEENLNPELTVEGIAEHFSVSKYHLGRLFSSQTGNTLYHYILIKKVAAAKKYLAQGYTVTETCALAGFNDYNNFIRTFRNLTGVSPGKYSRR